MQATNCPRCGRIFTKVKAPVCNACVKEDDNTFELVREFVKENPDRAIGDVSEETNVPIKRILQYIRDGRLEISQGMSGDVGCSQCGAPIVSGRFCEKCAAKIKTDFLQRPQSDVEKFQTKKSGKMHGVNIKR